jgi:hypothetical protein
MDSFGSMLLYVDVTNACPIGCAFCMYLPVQGDQHLQLDAVTTEVLGRLIRHAPVVHISGQGEPLTQPDRVLAVAALAGEGQEVEIITSGGVPWPRLEALLTSFEASARVHGFVPRLRMSVDRWHASAVRHRNHAAVIARQLRLGEGSTTVSFRSVTTERDWLPGFFAGELGATPNRWFDDGPLHGRLEVEGRHFDVAMKRLVRPAQAGASDALSLEEYVTEVAREKERPFTLGNLTGSAPWPGPDVTVRPDGTVHLYGLDGVHDWQLGDPGLDLGVILEAIRSDPVLRTFYGTPFIEIVARLGEDERLAKIIAEAANPYWIIPAIRDQLGDDFGPFIAGLMAREAM